MSALRTALTALSIAGWLCVLGTLVWDADIAWERYVRAHHCVPVDGSDLWSYVSRACTRECVPVQVDADTYQCDDGAWVQR